MEQRKLERFSNFKKIFKNADFIFLAFLAAASIKRVFLIERIVDVFFYDESFYLNNGVFKLPKYGLTAPSWGPLYSVWYYLLSLAETDIVKIYYLNIKVLTCITGFALYFYLRRLKVSPSASFVISSIHLALGLNFWLFPKPIHLALLLILLFASFSTFFKDKINRYFLLCMGCLLATYVRPEYFVSFLLLSMLLLYLFISRLKEKTEPAHPLKMFAFVLSFFVLFYIFGFPLGSEKRSFYAFSQHFSLNFTSWEGSKFSPWLEDEKIVKPVFGDAKSISEAMLSNPGYFKKHVLFNIANYGEKILDMFKINLIIPGLRKRMHTFTIQGSVIIFMLFACFVINIRKALPNIINGDKERLKDVIVLLLVVSIPVFLSSAIIYPKHSYLLIQSTLLLVLMTVLISFEPKMSLYKILMLGVFIFLVVPNGSGQWYFRPNISNNNYKFQNLNTIKFIKKLKIDKEVNNFEAGCAYVYLGRNYKQVPLWKYKANKESFSQFISRRKINMLIVGSEFDKYSEFTDNKEYNIFIKNPDKFGFLSSKIPHTNKILYVKASLLKQKASWQEQGTGSLVQQLYNLYNSDKLSLFNNVSPQIYKKKVQIANEMRNALVLLTPERMEAFAHIPENSYLKFGFGVWEKSFNGDGDGVQLDVFIKHNNKI